MKHVDTIVRRLEAGLETKTSELTVALEALAQEKRALLSRISDSEALLQSERTAYAAILQKLSHLTPFNASSS